jgi:hypothetical protein
LKLTAFAFSLLICASASLFAEPYFAIREGLKCSACHTNITGGGKRTRMGTGYGAIDLPWKPVDLQGRNIPHYFELVNQVISIGGDFRTFHRSTFSDEGPNTNTFQVDKSNLYLQADLIPEKLTFYLDETVAPGGAQTREIFGLLRNLPGRSWIKAGKFLPPFGLRLEDDRAFIREVTGFNFNAPDTGLEVGFEPGSFSIAASITNGTTSIADSDQSKQIVGTVGYIRDLFRLGVSGSHNEVDDDSRQVYGVWAGLKIKSAVFMGEADWIREDGDQLNRNQTVTYLEMDYKITNGWNAKLAYEYFDPDRDINENERDRVVVGIESFLTSFVQLQVFYKFNQSIPQNIPQNADELLLRLHLYF